MAGFAPQAFPTTISSPPLGLSPHSKQKSAPWDCSTIPALQLPATVPSRGPVWGVYGCSKSVQFSFCLDCHRSAALSIRCFSSDTKSCPDVGGGPWIRLRGQGLVLAFSVTVTTGNTTGRSPGKGNGSSLQCSCLEHAMGRGAWWATVHGVARIGHNLATVPPPPLCKFKYSVDASYYCS